MKFMFNFDIFSRLRWWQLTHAHLHGFAGLVFGILLLAAIPMYVATTMVIARTKAPLFNFNFKIPDFIKNAFIQTPLTEEPQSTVPDNTPISESTPEQKQETESAKTETPTETKTLPDNIPSEMRQAYLRAREHLSRVPVSAFDLANVTKSVSQNTPQDEPDTNEMPIPTDFDIPDSDDMTDNIPQFTDITFDDDEDEEYEEDTTTANDIHDTSDTTNVVSKYLESKSVPHTTKDDVVITDKFAIISHTDPDFWVADEAAWFAAGKTRKSPIELVKRIAAEHNVGPVLYLGANNIMDVENLIPQWEASGIRIITDLKDLI